jgi:hypothetical protein
MYVSARAPWWTQPRRARARTTVDPMHPQYVGLDAPAAALRAALRAPDTHCVLVCGAPGTGRTGLCEAAMRDAGCRVLRWTPDGPPPSHHMVAAGAGAGVGGPTTSKASTRTSDGAIERYFAGTATAPAARQPVVVFVDDADTLVAAVKGSARQLTAALGRAREARLRYVLTAVGTVPTARQANERGWRAVAQAAATAGAVLHLHAPPVDTSAAWLAATERCDPSAARDAAAAAGGNIRDAQRLLRSSGGAAAAAAGEAEDDEARCWVDAGVGFDADPAAALLLGARSTAEARALSGAALAAAVVRAHAARLDASDSCGGAGGTARGIAGAIGRAGGAEG